MKLVCVVQTHCSVERVMRCDDDSLSKPGNERYTFIYADGRVQIYADGGVQSYGTQQACTR